MREARTCRRILFPRNANYQRVSPARMRSRSRYGLLYCSFYLRKKHRTEKHERARTQCYFMHCGKRRRDLQVKSEVRNERALRAIDTPMFGIFSQDNKVLNGTRDGIVGTERGKKVHFESKLDIPECETDASARCVPSQPLKG